MKSILEDLTVEVVIHQLDSLPAWVNDILGNFVSYVAKGKYVFNLPLHWEGFHSDILSMMDEAFGQNVYFTLCFTSTGDDWVYDYYGNLVEPYEISDSGLKVKKFLKKKMIIVRKSRTSSVNVLAVSFTMGKGDPYLKDLEFVFLPNYGVNDLVSVLVTKVLPGVFAESFAKAS